MQGKILHIQLFALYNYKHNQSIISKWLLLNLKLVDISNKMYNHASSNMTLHDVE